MFKLKFTKREEVFEAENWARDILDGWNIHNEVGFSKLQEHDIIQIKSSLDMYMVDRKELMSSGERVFLQLITDNPVHGTGFDYLPLGEGYKILSQS